MALLIVSLESGPIPTYTRLFPYICKWHVCD